ncbi:site-specific DNA-methyltransferase [Bacillus cereus group sp. BfR-BA-01495]|uniref:site-specific DNA-methyltransferase n=1 Tax=Bacillus cereus group sp. BfR-BA-01495 TaxID=2920363 RepID=UPI001F585332|nr:site-specific DNA-methyltransferase [Bacillus cereus group sp. BfR-BA-01495]
METKINKEIKSVLEKFDNKYFVGNNVNKSKVIQDLDTYDKDLLIEFMHNETIKENFTIDIEGNIVLQTNKLIELFEADEYWQDSYTKYSKKIGLSVNGNFIDESTDVVLDFPYKDTVLKASMSKEDTDKDDLRPDEPFLNEVIAKEEIDVLLSPKVLTNVKKYDNQGEHEVTKINEKDNLIIKGNNLIALHSLKDRYAGKVKLIYIDPPYNTGGDSFKYNDRFNHSTWLTFMKNRLQVAYDLLTEDGAIFVQTDDAEQAYLKVLLDEVFGRKNYINTVSVLFKNTAGVSGGGEDKRLKKNIEYITIYTKNYDIHKGFNSIYSYIPISDLVKQYKDEGVSWKYTTALVDSGEKQYFGSTSDGSGSEIRIYKRLGAKTKSISQLMKEENLTEEAAYSKYAPVLFQTTNAQTSIRDRVMKYTSEHNNDADIISIEYVPRSGRNKGKVYEQFYKGGKCRLFAWLRDVTDTVNGELVKKDSLGTFWNHVASTKNVNKEGKVEFANGKKPEDLIIKIIEMATIEGDLVLDFFMGSATTQATAMKMNRQFIGIEQMDYIETVSVPRLQQVIEGEQGGISDEVNWQGGGSFIFVELMEKNRGFLKSIRDAKDQVELQKVFNFMLEEAEIDFKVDLEIVKNTLHELSLDDQKRTLLKIIDKNQLYYNYSEVDDENVRDLISDNDYAFNKSFYEERGE